MSKSVSLFSILLASVLLFGCASDNAKGSDRASSSEPHFAYSGPESPEHWGDITHEWLACSEGTGQSPIDLPAIDNIRRDNSMKPLVFDYEDSPLELLNNGHAIQLNYKVGSFLKIGDDMYELEQLHFHTPSEHTAQGHRADGELHLVHQNSNGDYAVVAVMLRADRGTDMSAKYAEVLSKIPKKAGETERTRARFNAQDLVPDSPGYVYYEGSLTTPPCSEHVRWFVLGSAVKINQAELEKLHAVAPDNVRPIMPLNNRQLKIGPAVKVR